MSVAGIHAACCCRIVAIIKHTTYDVLHFASFTLSLCCLWFWTWQQAAGLCYSQSASQAPGTAARWPSKRSVLWVRATNKQAEQSLHCASASDASSCVQYDDCVTCYCATCGVQHCRVLPNKCWQARFCACHIACWTWLGINTSVWGWAMLAPKRTASTSLHATGVSSSLCVLKLRLIQASGMQFQYSSASVASKHKAPCIA